ncbi:cytochrome o ubiquinol oxidase subunit IV [Paraburkholderia dinghuensis]|uniref:Cytochrome bo(3) ubiquinol oxidase subunit 4 n=1 Tax=Paraburkholderia dinghuensis TaxID=2305225 RepID=A0A3N6N470_9BURK|nr:cytochrome o ubiquinol oxidase subunit IV [Paraburkholderia dinghuensis]RQH05391.1 cytochrome o ubiquinol oxidase subunit IV [Paraburkholderia dinghuensis]
MAHSQSQAHGSLGGYAVGFILSVILTAAAFGLVLHGTFTSSSALFVLAILAFVQVIVHLVFFLHLNTSKGQGMNVLSLGYTVLAAAFLIFGTIWVMNNVTMLMMSR